MKAILRHEKVRAADELSAAVARAFSCISHADCLVWFRIVVIVQLWCTFLPVQNLLL